jgi:hypothetical protein
LSVTEWLAEATAERREVPVCFDRRLLGELARARAELEDLPREEGTNRKTDRHDELEAEVAALEEQVKAKTRKLVFEGIGWGPWRRLLSDHPPQADQAEVFKKAVEYRHLPHELTSLAVNSETFWPAAIARCCVDPRITPEEATRLFDEPPPGVIDRIVAAVMEVNTAGGRDPFVLDFDHRNNSGKKSPPQ